MSDGRPVLSADIIIELEGGIVLVKRKYPPYGWALPGGHVDNNESVYDAAIREAKEETGLDVKLESLLGVYSKPGRDPRKHMVAAVYIASATGVPKAADDAKEVMIFKGHMMKPVGELPEMAFDHKNIISDYYNWLLYRFYPKLEQ